MLKGFAEEPVCGSSFTDGKFPYVNRKDFDEMFAEVKKLAEDSHDAQLCLFKIMYIFKAEKTDIGIYKAMGFTSDSLRLQFAVRFLIVAVLGLSIGTAASLCFSEKPASLMLRSMDIAKFVIEYRFMTVALPIIAVALSYFLFAFITASRTKRIEVRSLITE